MLYSSSEDATQFSKTPQTKMLHNLSEHRKRAIYKAGLSGKGGPVGAGEQNPRGQITSAGPKNG